MKLLKTTIVISLLSLSACNYFMTGRSADKLIGGGSGNEPAGNEKLTDDELQKLTPEQITFAVVKANVMDVSCTKCHSFMSDESQVMAMLSKVQVSVETDSMPLPKYPISAAQKQLLLTWIAKVQGPTNPPEPEQPVPPVVEPPPVQPPGENPLLTDEEVAGLKDTDLTYALVNKNAIEQSCLGCHSESAKKPKRPLLDTYARIVENKQAVHDAVLSEDMPPKGMSDVRRQLILRWLDLGAPLVSVPTEEPPVEVLPPQAPPSTEVPGPVLEEKVLFAEVSAKVFVPHCIRCHGEGEDFDLNQIAHAQAAAQGIKEQVVSKKMPKGKNNSLSDQQIQLVVKWVDQGAN